VPRYHRLVDPRVFSLNAHAEYACRHSGACCTAGWSIPVEPELQPHLHVEWLVPGPDRTCPEYDRTSGLCGLQCQGGEAMLPRSCHHFPRRALVDERGTFVALSNFCPTAADLLIKGTAPLTVIDHPPAFPAARGYEGLDARGEWPPLLRADVLFDPASFTLWERHLVERIGQSAQTVEATLASIAATGERLREWSVDRGPLVEWTRQILGATDRIGIEAGRRYAEFTGLAAYLGALDTVPAGLDSPRAPDGLEEADASLVAPAWDTLAPFALRYLGARGFASWTAYQARGIRTQIAELFMTAAVLRVECARACTARQRMLDVDMLTEAVRASDLLLVHLADRTMLMAWLGKVETDAPSPPRA
jgi:hypothetical protein